MTATVPGRPTLRYHGGKWRIAPWVIAHLPPHRIYVEPFAGAASVLMQKRRVYGEVLNDLNAEVVNLFHVLRDKAQAKELERALLLTPFARQEFEDAYETADDPIEQARRLVIRSFMGFGSAACNVRHQTGFRNDSKRSGCTPAHDWANYPQYLAGMTRRLQGVCIEHKPAVYVIERYDESGCLFYCDPPYVFSTRRSMGRKNHLYEHEMTDDDHRELSAVLHKVKGMVVLSGYRSALYDELYAGWSYVERLAYADGAEARTEVLWFSPAAARNLQKTLPFEGEE